MEDIQQISFVEVDGTIVFFNEAEAVCDLDAPEPETLEAPPERRKRQKAKKSRTCLDFLRTRSIIT